MTNMNNKRAETEQSLAETGEHFSVLIKVRANVLSARELLARYFGVTRRKAPGSGNGSEANSEQARDGIHQTQSWFMTYRETFAISRTIEHHKEVVKQIRRIHMLIWCAHCY